MENNKVQAENPLNRRIYCLKKTIVPFKISTMWIDDFELLESCRSFHGYVSEAYDDMLNNPAENYIDPENPLYNDTYSWGDIFGWYLYFHKSILISFLEEAYCAEADFIVIKNEEYDKMYKKMKSKYTAEIKTEIRLQMIHSTSLLPKFDEMFNSLKRRGIEINRSESETVITNIKYPKMFQSAKLLFETVNIYNKKTKRTPRFGFDDLDFRFIENPNRKYEVEDIFISLSPIEEKITKELISTAKKNNLECRFNTKSKGPDNGDYMIYHNKTWISSFIWRTKYGYRINISLPQPESVEHKILLAEIDKLENAEEIKNFCAETLIGCMFCNKGCVQSNSYKMKLSFLGRKMPRLPTSCGGRGIKLHFKPDEKNFDLTKTLIGLLAEIY